MKRPGRRAGAPDAQQLVDRWHLLKNLGDAFHRLLNKYNRELRETATQIAQAKEISIENNALERLPTRSRFGIRTGIAIELSTEVRGGKTASTGRWTLLKIHGSPAGVALTYHQKISPI